MAFNLQVAKYMLKSGMFDDAIIKEALNEALAELFEELEPEVKHLVWVREALDTEIKRRKEE